MKQIIIFLNDKNEIVNIVDKPQNPSVTVSFGDCTAIELTVEKLPEVGTKYIPSQE